MPPVPNPEESNNGDDDDSNSNTDHAGHVHSSDATTDVTSPTAAGPTINVNPLIAQESSCVDASWAPLPTPLVVVQYVYGQIVVGGPFRPVEEGEQGAVPVKGFGRYDGGVPDLHPDPVSGLQFVHTS